MILLFPLIESTYACDVVKTFQFSSYNRKKRNTCKMASKGSIVTRGKKITQMRTESNLLIEKLSKNWVNQQMKKRSRTHLH